MPVFPVDALGRFVAEAAAVALVSFTSGIVTTRAFAAKNRYDIDVDREFAALGAAQHRRAVSQGFPVAGADSRTATNDAADGRTQVTGPGRGGCDRTRPRCSSPARCSTRRSPRSARC